VLENLSKSRTRAWEEILIIISALESAFEKINILHHKDHSLSAQFNDFEGESQVVFFGINEQSKGIFFKSNIQTISYVFMSQNNFHKYGLEREDITRISGSEKVEVNSKYEENLAISMKKIGMKIGLEYNYFNPGLPEDMKHF
jgi:hypothetical protein